MELRAAAPPRPRHAQATTRHTHEAMYTHIGHADAQTGIAYGSSSTKKLSQRKLVGANRGPTDAEVRQATAQRRRSVPHDTP
eukprot:3624254-Pyramimonas_sp.AAC.1